MRVWYIQYSPSLKIIMIDEEFLFNILNSYNIVFNMNFLKRYHKDTINHLLRCGNVACLFAEYVGFPIEEKNKLIKCALLHDIGKFTLNPAILYKEDKLTNIEFEYIKKHIHFKNNISNLDKCIQECINYHHDNVESTGYNKLNVSLKHDYVKIISIIDAYDVMNNKRCYKHDIYDLSKIVDEIEKNKDKQFDLYYGNKFIEFLKEKT